MKLNPFVNSNLVSFLVVYVFLRKSTLAFVYLFVECFGGHVREHAATVIAKARAACNRRREVRKKFAKRFCENFAIMYRFCLDLQKMDVFYGCFLWFELLNFYFLPFVLVMNLSQNKLEQIY